MFAVKTFFGPRRYHSLIARQIDSEVRTECRLRMEDLGEGAHCTPGVPVMLINTPRAEPGVLINTFFVQMTPQ